MNKFYSYGKQTIEQDDIDAVVKVLKGDWLTQGPYVKKFEDDLAKKFNAKYVSAVANGTAGLHLIGLALGWQKGDIVITTPITFLASSNCILYCGATPDFVDIDSVSYTMDINKLEQKLKDYQVIGKKVKAVVAVDYAGLPCDWEKLKLLAEKYSFQLVNDNCHALGAEINDDIAYAAKYADVVNMSFHPVKHITTGEGGAILTNNPELEEKIKILRTHGMTKDEKYLTKNDGPWYYEMQQLGFNYRITDFQCALGSSQLKKLDRFVKSRNEIAEYYDKQFSNDERFISPCVQEKVKHAYHLYPLQIKFDKLKISKKELFEKLKKKNIGLQVHYIPVHLQPYYKNNFGFKEGDYPVAEEFYKNEVSIPIYPLLENDDLEYIAKKIKELTK
ncbi:MAG: UDP-4-amino-4,6-dideoxy-N-acetyl-beta-L-altrosamine transaminase [Ignavibacteriales bacterium]|nr:UDP-4-amino-4,6-dideoxy-N-acetyl-beta-L-altrosamine transaminase [Ignavibacteriales bacterium]